MNLKHYKSYFITEKYYTSVFKKKIKEDYNPEGVPEPSFQVKVQNKIKKAKDDLSDAQRQSDPELINYWNDFIYCLQNYLSNSDFGNVKKIANQKPDQDISEGQVEAAKFLMRLYKK